MAEPFYRFAELRAEGRTLQGVLVRYGDTAQQFRERIEPGAFGDVASLDVLLNVQHTRAKPLARSKGGGLELRDSAEELAVSASLPATREADDTLELVRAGVLRGFSAEFFPVKMREDAGVSVISEARLAGLSVVDSPAYKESRITAIREEQQQPKRRRRLWL